jgi:hypothetical protein
MDASLYGMSLPYPTTICFVTLNLVSLAPIINRAGRKKSGRPEAAFRTGNRQGRREEGWK